MPEKLTPERLAEIRREIEPWGLLDDGPDAYAAYTDLFTHIDALTEELRIAKVNESVRADFRPHVREILERELATAKWWLAVAEANGREDAGAGHLQNAALHGLDILHDLDKAHERIDAITAENERLRSAGVTHIAKQEEKDNE